MKLTPDQRRQRLFEIMDRNPEYLRLKTTCDRARDSFLKRTGWLPPALRDRIREYPGMMYFMYQRIIDTVCSQMEFPDEA